MKPNDHPIILGNNGGSNNNNNNNNNDDDVVIDFNPVNSNDHTTQVDTTHT